MQIRLRSCRFSPISVLNPFLEIALHGSFVALTFLFAILILRTRVLESSRGNLVIRLIHALWKNIVWRLIWVVLLIFNVAGLIRYTWAVTLYPFLDLWLALTAWIGVTVTVSLYIRMKWNNRRMGHYLPTASPTWLWLILPMIELVRQFIRPFTLTVRLMANLLAGHIILFLVGCLPWLTVSVFTYIILIPFEAMVAMVQSVVFVLLLQTYRLER